MKFRVGDTVKWQFKHPDWWGDMPKTAGSYPIETVRITRIEPDVYTGTDKIWGYFNNEKKESYVHADDDGWIANNCAMEAMQ